MISPRLFSFFSFLILFSGAIAGGEDATAPASLKGLDGKPVVVVDAGSKKAVVLFFVSPYCPTSNKFGPEMAAIEADFVGDFNFRYIHSESSVTAADILQHASMMGFESPVLDDTAQVLAKKLGAKITPEVFVLDGAGKVLYRGRINDLYLGPMKRQREIKTHDLRDALEAIKAGTPVATPRHEAVGCRITTGE